MKKIFLLALVTVLGINSSNAQETAKKSKPTAAKTVKVDGAGMVFVSETIDYGTIAHNSNGKREFVFTNNGTKPLIITNIRNFPPLMICCGQWFRPCINIFIIYVRIFTGYSRIIK